MSRKLLTRIILYLPALSLECYECTNSPGFSGVSKCDSDEVTKRTCDALADRCMTVTYNFTLLTSQIIETKNCSNSLACDPDFAFNCKYLLAYFFCIYQSLCTAKIVLSIFSLSIVLEQSLFCSKMREKAAVRSERDMRSREPHVTLTVTLTRNTAEKL